MGYDTDMRHTVRLCRAIGKITVMNGTLQIDTVMRVTLNTVTVSKIAEYQYSDSY